MDTGNGQAHNKRDRHRMRAFTNQLRHDHQTGRVTLSEAARKRIGQVIDASANWGGMPAILKEIGFTAPRLDRGPGVELKRSCHQLR